MTDLSYSIALGGLANHLGIPEQDFLENPALSIDNVTFTLSLSERPPMTCLQAACVVTKIPPGFPTDQLHLLLRMNLLGAATQGGPIGLQREGQLVLAQRFALDTPLSVITRHLHTMADCAKQWEAAIFKSIWN